MNSKLIKTAVLSGILLTSTAYSAITYVNADFATNTTLADGTAMNLVADEAAVTGAGNPQDYYVTADGTINNSGGAGLNWGQRNRSSVNNGFVLVGPQTASGNAPELRTRLTGLVDGTYNLYAYFMSQGADWRLQAGLTQGNLTEFIAGTNAPLAVAGDFDNAVVLADSANITLYQASLGTAVVSGGVLDIFIDDISTDAGRTWYEGVGFEAIPEPSSTALLSLASLALLSRRCRK